jgi:hypothetical protein
MLTNIPGLKASHQIITPTCRANRGLQGAFDEAVRRVTQTYADCAPADGNEEVRWHLVLVREEVE